MNREEILKEIEQLERISKDCSESLKRAIYLAGTRFEIQKSEAVVRQNALLELLDDYPVQITSKAKHRLTAPYRKCQSRGK